MSPTITVGVFRDERSTFLFICSTTSNLNNFKPQKRVQNEKKKQNRRSELRKHTKDPPIAPLFFSTMRLFETFWIAPKGPLFICFDILQHNGCPKIAKGPPFYIFRHCDTVQKSHFKIFLGKFFSCPQRVPFIFFPFFATSWSFTKPEGSPFSILSPRYGADFGHSRLVCMSSKFAQKCRKLSCFSNLEFFAG